MLDLILLPAVLNVITCGVENPFILKNYFLTAFLATFMGIFLPLTGAFTAGFLPAFFLAIKAFKPAFIAILILLHPLTFLSIGRLLRQLSHHLCVWISWWHLWCPR